MPDDRDETGDGQAEERRGPFEFAGGTVHGAIVQGASVQNVFIGNASTTTQSTTVEDPRERFLASFREQALTQAGNTFRLSMFFVSAGSVILLCGAALVLFRHGSAASSTAGLMTGLSGVLISTCGGAFALHANRARRHLTAQADRVSEELRSDHTFQQSLDLIDRVEDPALRDRLRSITAMRALGLAPTPEDAANRVLPVHDSRNPEIEPKPPAE
ncbi:hypothetical protein OHV13_15075 [Kitasatospora purpeofusca]|uniref:TRADD-N-associated membrane domain-containing protein n=1 Tax=Kitasatospora purpeofusca TaxID=67352 RepID=UPI0032499A3E